MVLYSSLGKTFPAFTRPKIGLLGWSNSSMDFKYFYVHIFPRPLIRRIYLRFIFLCFILILRKTYRSCIPLSRDFTRLGPLAFLWISLNEKNMKIRKFIQHYIHWESKLYIHNINIFHKHGTCLEASAFRELKILIYKQTDQVHDFVHHKFVHK